MKEKYIRQFGNDYQIPSPKQDYLMKIVKDECKRNNMVCDANELFAYMHQFEEKNVGTQLSLFDI
jgi:hypothetical protein